MGDQAKVSITWIQGSLVLGNLAVLFTAVVIVSRQNASKTGGPELESFLHTFIAQVTLLAWYQLRQEHFLAMADILENQGVVVRVTQLYYNYIHC